MPAIKYKVELTPSQRSTLVAGSRPGQAVSLSTLKRALALLKARRTVRPGGRSGGFNER